MVSQSTREEDSEGAARVALEAMGLFTVARGSSDSKGRGQGGPSTVGRRRWFRGARQVEGKELPARKALLRGDREGEHPRENQELLLTLEELLLSKDLTEEIVV